MNSLELDWLKSFLQRFLNVILVDLESMVEGGRLGLQEDWGSRESHRKMTHVADARAESFGGRPH
jgi:hypothetical protein